MSEVPHKEVHVLAGVIFDARNRVLLAQRPEGKDLAGLWEFPGGKIEPGETRFQALARELDEELGIQIGPARPLTRVRHAYHHKTVLLDFWIVRAYTGEALNLEGQSLRWCEAGELMSVPILPADRPMLRLIDLPDVLETRLGSGFEVLEGTPPASATRVAGIVCDGLSSARTAVANGADFLVMNAVLSTDDARRLCDETVVPVYLQGVDLATAWQLGATGITRLPR